MMELHLHLIPAAKDAKEELKLGLSRVRRQKGAEWRTTTFDARLKGPDVAHKFKKPGTAAFVHWLLRSQANHKEPIDQCLSKALNELLRKQDRSTTWPGCLLGGDPLELFQKDDSGRWQPSRELESAQIRVWSHGHLRTEPEPWSTEGVLQDNACELKDSPEVWRDAAARLLARGLSLEVWIKGPNAPNGEPFDPESPIALTTEDKLEVRVANLDGEQRNVAVICLSPSGRAHGFWPWIPDPRDNPTGFLKSVHAGRNPKEHLSLPKAWTPVVHAEPQSIQMDDKGSAECILAFTYEASTGADLATLNSNRERLREMAQKLAKHPFGPTLQKWPVKGGVDIGGFAITRDPVIKKAPKVNHQKDLEEKLKKGIESWLRETMPANTRGDITWVRAVVIPKQLAANP